MSFALGLPYLRVGGGSVGDSFFLKRPFILNDIGLMNRVCFSILVGVGQCCDG